MDWGVDIYELYEHIWTVWTGEWTYMDCMDIYGLYGPRVCLGRSELTWMDRVRFCGGVGGLAWMACTHQGCFDRRMEQIGR